MLSRSLRPSYFWNLAKNARPQSTAAAGQSLINLDVDSSSGIATISLNNKPVNCLSLKLLKEFCDKIDQLEKDKIKGAILTSSVNNVFCAGLDFGELIRPTEENINAYWVWFQESFIKLHGSNFPTAALVSGHALAGGCVYAFSCEYRVMLPKFTIGLPEVPVGIVPPQFVIDGTRLVTSNRQAEMMLLTGDSFDSQKAFEMGIVDELATDYEDGKKKCLAFLKKFEKISPVARNLTKQYLRKETLDLLKDPKSRSEDAKRFCGHILKPATQQALIEFSEKLKSKKK